MSKTLVLIPLLSLILGNINWSLVGGSFVWLPIFVSGSQADFNNLLDDDAVRVLNLVNDFSAWDSFPWGQYIWEEFHKRVYNNDHTFRKGHLKKIATLGSAYLPTYNLQGFVFPLKWKSSLEYFHNVSNASTSSHAPSNKKKLRFKRKVVSREVHVRNDVHHYVDERLSVQDLVKKIGDMQREFQSRITAVEQYVNQHKTSSTANDSPVDNVFSDTRNFDHDSFSRFTENPDDRAALINKITDMRVDFQRRITAIEQYLKISTSSNVEKTSNVVQDCMNVDKNPSCGFDNHVKTSVESYVDNQNVDNHSMDFHQDPRTLFESDVNNHSMDFDHDPKVLEQQNISGKNLFDEFEQQVSLNNLFNHEALVEPNVAVKNLFQDEDQQFSSKNLDVQQEAQEEPNVDQQFSTKKLDAQLEMEKLFVVDTLCSMIDFDIPKEQLHNQLPTEPMIPEATVQGCNNLKTVQSFLTEYESQHAIHDQFDTLSMKNADFVHGSNDAKVDVNPTVAVNSLRVPLERDHKVSRFIGDRQRKAWLANIIEQHG
ncbi:hypothetical protein Tco_0322354 [Tanacetum coccineum]